MLKLHLDYKPQTIQPQINQKSKIILAGSCFSTHIGDRLLNSGIDVLQNPYGILFNPLSIIESIENCADEKIFTEEDLIKHNDLYLSIKHHSSYSNTSKSQCLENINNSISKTRKFLEEAQYLILTLGSAFGYYTDKTLAGNCHKLPAENFTKRIQEEGEIEWLFYRMRAKLLLINPDIKIILTVSPVKHLRDGIIENSLSKARLISLVNKLCPEYAAYFPAYELVTDDLRDYRFYEEDMAHPNNAAINYVWEKFCATSMSQETLQLSKEINTIKSAVNHKIFFPESATTKKFIENMIDKIQTLKYQHPHINLNPEELHFKTLQKR
ncbi:MAG: GSCFA domain-containing protein [Bacteroidia bacterium]|nr:GSCFA domain-containing protein [Bacteroidia bacterium]